MSLVIFCCLMHWTAPNTPCFLSLSSDIRSTEPPLILLAFVTSISEFDLFKSESLARVLVVSS